MTNLNQITASDFHKAAVLAGSMMGTWLDRVALSLMSDLGRARRDADIIGCREKFEDVFILGNDEMRHRAGLQYSPREIVQTLCAFDY